MSILIRGMEMPVIELEWTIRHGADGKWYAIDTNAETSDGEWHEIVSVPAHGDLIDRDAYEKLLRGLGSRDYRREKGTICDAIKFLHPHYAPTIIPASKEDEV